MVKVPAYQLPTAPVKRTSCDTEALPSSLGKEEGFDVYASHVAHIAQNPCWRGCVLRRLRSAQVGVPVGRG